MLLTVLAYTSRCSGRTVGLLRDAGWRFIVEPSQGYRRDPCPLPYGLDSGAWACHRAGVPFDEDGFRRVLKDHGETADWIVLPDIVGGGAESLALSLSWVPEVSEHKRPLLLAVQDGMTVAQIEPLLSSVGVGLFLGGSTEWKLSTMRQWGTLARRAGCWYHVARVNSQKRITLCQDAGATSFDGSSPTKFSCTLPRLDHARKQGHLFGGLD